MTLKRWLVLVGLALVFTVGVLSTPVQAQAGLIIQYLNRFLVAPHTWTGTQTFQNVTINGSCTGCGGGGGTAAQWVRGDGMTSQTMVGGTVAASAPWTWTQTWNNGAVTFVGLDVNVTKTASAQFSNYFNVENALGSIFRVTQDLNGSPASGSVCIGVNDNATDSGTSTNFAFRAASNQISLTGGCNAAGTRGFFAGSLQAGTNWSSSPLATITAGSNIGLTMASVMPIRWSNSSSDGSGSATFDIGLIRNAAGVVEVNNGTTGTFRDLLARSIQTNPTTVGGLPTCVAGLKGARQFVTDANANTFHTTAATGGGNNVAVVCDGTNWYID